MEWNQRGTPRQYENNPTRLPKRFQSHSVGGIRRHLDSTYLSIVRTFDGMERPDSTRTTPSPRRLLKHFQPDEYGLATNRLNSTNLSLVRNYDGIGDRHEYENTPRRHPKLFQSHGVGVKHHNFDSTQLSIERIVFLPMTTFTNQGTSRF